MTTKPPTKAQALRRAANRQKSLTRAEWEATQYAKDRDDAVRQAKDAGATYPEIAEATGLSITRVTQVLRRTKQTT